MRVGIGYDVHKLVKGRKLILGGLEIPYEYGLDGHSDADVLTHAVMDAILGAMGLGDIGSFFPDTDERYKDADSLLLLREIVDLSIKKGYFICNIDSVIMAEEPKLMPQISQMKKRLSKVLGINENLLGIKATTTEGLGFVGRKEGIAAQAVVLLKHKENF